MTQEIVKQKSRGFICVNAHPDGCRVNVERQVNVIARNRTGKQGVLRNVLVVGASTGYGLASRVTASWGYGARTLGVFLEKPPDRGRTATAGYYNTVAFHRLAEKDGLFAASINGDAFSDEVKRRAAETIRTQMAPVDLVIYSLASPRRTHPRTGQVHQSVLKPIRAPYTSHTIDLDSERVTEITMEPASQREIADTVAVMGGEDWRLWIEMLLESGLLAPNARTIAYSYLGPELTWPIYWHGTVGAAKQDLERTANDLSTTLQKRVAGDAWISVNKAIVTQASAAIPVMPLYMSILTKVMRQSHVDEGAIEQMERLFRDFVAIDGKPGLDEARRIRLDDREMRPEVQESVKRIWPTITTEDLRKVTDFASFKTEFRNLFGFEVSGVDYGQSTEIDLAW
jgi:enoyl-[acyl-carrier protein] reductase / trans-2-enoyl-CoA reductase (NAD+)